MTPVKNYIYADKCIFGNRELPYLQLTFFNAPEMKVKRDVLSVNPTALPNQP